MIRISDLTVQKYGVRGLSISLPSIFHQPRNLNPKDKLFSYLTRLNGVECLIVSPNEIPVNVDVNIASLESKNLVDNKLTNL